VCKSSSTGIIGPRFKPLPHCLKLCDLNKSLPWGIMSFRKASERGGDACWAALLCKAWFLLPGKRITTFPLGGCGVRGIDGNHDVCQMTPSQVPTGHPSLWEADAGGL
jgi:hypothetical protein